MLFILGTREFNIIGIDRSKEMLMVARNKIKKVGEEKIFLLNVVMQQRQG